MIDSGERGDCVCVRVFVVCQLISSSNDDVLRAFQFSKKRCFGVDVLILFVSRFQQETSTLSDSISDNMEENIKSSTPVEHNKTKSTNSSSENQLPTDVTDNSESEAETQIK